VLDRKGEFLPDFMEKYRFLRERDASRKEALKHLALTKAADVAGMLRDKYGVDRFYMYGSLAWGGFGERSDIDLLAIPNLKSLLISLTYSHD
jgi:hypothetical protein